MYFLRGSCCVTLGFGSCLLVGSSVLSQGPMRLPLDQNQALRLCLGSTSVGGQYGAISALSINNDCSRLLCGFAKGQVR